jgi:hypothetical protein
MVTSFFWLALFSASPAYAEGTPHSPHGIHVLQMDADFPIEKLETKDLTTHPLSAVGKDSETLPVSVLQRFFRESGMAPFIQDWGALELDLLALRCENHEPRRVLEKYQNRIPLRAIEKFQTLARNYRRERDRK